MSSLALPENHIPAMSSTAIEKVRELEALASQLPQVAVPTWHFLHAGMYARKITVPAGAALTGTLIKIATLLIVEGDVVVSIGTETIELRGHNILPASAHRKLAFLALTDAYLTMVFPSNAKSIEEAEEEFTDEAHLLFSRQCPERNHITITGE